MAVPELVIFDCDGVLVDSEPLAAEEFSAALATLGLARDPAAIDAAFRGRRLADCLPVVEDWLGRPLPGDFAHALVARTRVRFERDLAPVPGIEAALTRIRSELRLPVCVASSGEPEKIRHSLALTGLDAHFGDALFSGTEVPRGKPAPDLFLHAAAAMGVPAQSCVVVEDASAGIAGALAAGMRVLAYRSPAEPASPMRTDFLRMDALPGLLVASRPEADGSTDRLAGNRDGVRP